MPASEEGRAMSQDMLDIERKVARCRILLSLFALAAIYLDPINPIVIGQFGSAGGPLRVDARALSVLGAHLGYSLAVLASLSIGHELVRRGRAEEALVALGEHQASITREYDGLRTYIRELADHETAPPSFEFDTRFAVNAQFGGTGPLVEHVLQILLEGVRNVRRHAFARAASIEAHAAGPDIQIRIDDDGLGFADGAGAPWSISSRVDQLGGQVQLARDSRAGAHLAIALRTV